MLPLRNKTADKVLQRHAETLSRFAAETAARARAAPDDFFLQLAAANQEKAARDAAHQVKVEDEGCVLLDEAGLACPERSNEEPDLLRKAIDRSAIHRTIDSPRMEPDSGRGERLKILLTLSPL